MNAYSILQPYLEEAIKRDALDITQWGKWRSCCGGGFNRGQGRLYGRFGGWRSVGGTESCTRSKEYNGKGGQHRWRRWLLSLVVWILESRRGSLISPRASCVNIWQRHKCPLGERVASLVLRARQPSCARASVCLLPCQGAWGWGKPQNERDRQNQARRHVGFTNPL